MTPTRFVKMIHWCSQVFQFLPNSIKRTLRPKIWENFGAGVLHPALQFPRHPLLIDQGDSVLKIGARNTYLIDHYRQLVGSQGKVTIIEPTNDSYQRLNSYSEAFDNVSVHQLAVGPEKGMVEINTSEMDLSGARITNNTQEFITTYSDTQEVMAQPLDLVCENYSINPDYIEVMTNGTELMVLESGEQFLSEQDPKVLAKAYGAGIKDEGDVPEIKKYLQECGYHLALAPIGNNPRRYHSDGDIFAFK